MRVVSKKGKRKSKRPVGAPKLPLSSYMEFVLVERPVVKEELGDLGLKEMG